MRREMCLGAVGFLLLTLAPYVLAGAADTGSEEVPKVILSGLDAYKAEGPEAAIKAWLKGSPVEGSKEALSQANNLRQIQDFYGAYKTFHLVQSRNISPTSRIIYLVLDHEKGPVFYKFLVFRTEQGWILTSFYLNTHPEQVLPDCR
jgi:hypothetical protein